MPQRTPSCQLGAHAAPDTRPISPLADDTQCRPFTPVRGIQQEIDHTASRRSGPRKWLRAVQWLIGAGLHPKANTTTMRVAEDLAARMDYDLGHVRYGLNDMVTRLGLSRGYICKHIGYLRELGALVWVQHGNSTNINRLKGLLGYAGTATVYAAVIPPVYDHAMGHTIVGQGYEARVVIDQRGQAPATPEPVDNPPVDNSSSRGEETPSLTWLREESQVQVVGGSNYTSQARPPKTRPPHHSNEINGRRRTAADVQKAGKTARLVRALVNWTQSVPLRRLEYVLRPWTDRGQDAYQIAADLHGMCSGMRWKPARPDAFIQARLTADREHQQQIQAEQDAAARWEQENPVQGAFTAHPSQQHDVMAALREGMARYQQTARAHGWDDLSHGESADWDAEADIAAFLGSNA